MQTYGWIVTVDTVADPEPASGTRVGFVGPRTIGGELESRLRAGEGVEWRTGDEDGNWSYYGRLILDSATTGHSVAQWDSGADGDAWSAPLDNLGAPDCGDCVIEHKNPRTGEWETIVG